MFEQISYRSHLISFPKHSAYIILIMCIINVYYVIVVLLNWLAPIIKMLKHKLNE